MPLEKVVTSTYAEYATIYARMSRHVGHGSGNPMTINEGEGIQSQAERFIVKFCTPLLDFIHTEKVHKLLRHFLDAIRWHCNISSGHSAENEAAYKDEKAFYARKNRDLES